MGRLREDEARILDEGLQSYIVLDAPKPGEPLFTRTATQPIYQLSVEEIDALLSAIFDTASVNAAFFTNPLNPGARATLERAPRAPII